MKSKILSFFVGSIIGILIYVVMYKMYIGQDEVPSYIYNGEETDIDFSPKENQELIGPYNSSIIALDNYKVAFMYANIILTKLVKDRRVQLSPYYKVTLLNNSIWKIENHYKKKDVNKKVVLMLKKRDGEVIGYFFEN